VLCPANLEAVVERDFLEPAMRSVLYTKLVALVGYVRSGWCREFIVSYGLLHYVPFPALLAVDSSTLLRTGRPEVVFDPAAGKARSVAWLIGAALLVGDAPKLTDFVTEAGRYRQLYLSNHGTFHPDHLLAAGLRISSVETLTACIVCEHVRLACDIVVLIAIESGLRCARYRGKLICLDSSFLTASAQLFLRELTCTQITSITKSFVACDLLPKLFDGAVVPPKAVVKKHRPRPVLLAKVVHTRIRVFGPRSF
jgi:hypothetical protein